MTPQIGYFKEKRNTHPADLPELAYAWLESAERVCLVRRADVPDWADLNAWPAGRLFGETGEYRWQFAQGFLHGVLLLEEQSLPASFSANQALVLEHEQDSDLILWGGWVDPTEDPVGNPDDGARFYAGEIPGIHCYPIDEPLTAGTTPRLRVRRYRHETKGEFIRCVGFTTTGADSDGEENQSV